MASLVIRELDEYTVSRIEQLAKEKNMSREKFLRNVLRNISIAGEMAELENKYINMLDQVLEMLQVTTSVLERNTEVMTELEQRLER